MTMIAIFSSQILCSVSKSRVTWVVSLMLTLGDFNSLGNERDHDAFGVLCRVEYREGEFLRRFGISDLCRWPSQKFPG